MFLCFSLFYTLNIRFLRLLAEHDWAFSPLVVDINGDLSQNDDKEIDVSFAVQKMINN